jgi:hypothetical protein
MGANYLPFAMRENVVVAANGVSALSVVTAAFSGRFENARVEYQDAWLLFISGDVLMRYGFEGRGYLLEEPLNGLSMLTGEAPERQGWRFPRPYRLDPGQMMRVDYELPTAGVFGCMLHCKRMDDGRNFLLYGSNIVASAATAIGTLTGDYMKCPADTPILIEGISANGSADLSVSTTQVGMQVYDGNGRELLTKKFNAGGTVTDRQMRYDWLSPSNQFHLELGRYDGWELPTQNPFIMEFEETAGNTAEILVLVRGSIEVKS